ncbi:hypothetical protein OIDMADRAFT_125578 [Oidiodendron maius Zn]|uniref:Major facilitator superfamily (MFS) profile domain-containing protein n=1 Tax=Oidiodendron maius (strain Zn) TaxID=913774 RepID=A0A0C3HBP4_OIDMZ|nr:hypothetical protein OIDMADRAFT_125578 [Oidiodendron maius Zn]
MLGGLVVKTLNNSSSIQLSSVNQERHNDFRPGTRLWLAFMTISVLGLMVALDGSSISVALPVITPSLNGTAIEAFWTGTSFLLCCTVFQPSFGSLSNIFGRRPLILTALIFFLVGAIVAGISTNFLHMLVGRSIQGIGGGGVIALSEIIVTDLVPLRLRGQYFGIVGSMASVGAVTGPLLGGGFSDKVSWRWIFYINFPFIGIGIILVILFLNLHFTPTSLKSKLQRIDYVGTFLFVGSSTSFLIPVTWGGVIYAWDSVQTLVPLLIGAVGFIVFILYEKHFATDPMIPMSIFKTQTAVVNYVGTFVHGLALWCCLYYLPLYFEAVKGYSPVIAGVALFPNVLSVVPGGITAGILITYFGYYRWALWSGWIFCTLGMGLLCLIESNTSIAGWIFLMISSGLGLGILFPSIVFAIQASATPSEVAMAVAMCSFFRSFGQAIGIAIGGSIFQNRMYANLLGYPALAPYADEYSKDAAALVEIIRSMPSGGDKNNLRNAYTDSLRIVWAMCCALAGATMVLSVLTKEYDLNPEVVQINQGFIEEKNSGSQEEEGVV